MGLGFRVWGPGCLAQREDMEFRIWGFRVWGPGFKILGEDLEFLV